ncbi:hypothetical protein BJ138DRAFT_1119367 [Hygrophoropsis aurantiaca]|uniref:Uncharacterized protein n=1 Tax=Hygrophoropsis aurantiaca TaxID=72124 RepID=A0ACB7ZU74_9AGAM|nr:hypothetical protein BJ138DRAFT_1119367 [Hygrophoropsis aurantiaca]
MGTMGEVVDGISNPNQCRFILDYGLHHLSSLGHLSLLDDGLVAGWNSTTTYRPATGTRISADNWMCRSWGLAHQAAIPTWPHHDADGYNTFIIPMSGVKFWVALSFKNKKLGFEEMSELAERLCDSDDHIEDISSQMDIERIHLYPGDLAIQPSGAFHSVYTPDASFTIGGHFFTYNTLHLTEMARRIDHTSGYLTTNQFHEHTQETLCRMVLGIPYLYPGTKLYERPMLALCVMVCNQRPYTVKEVGVMLAEHQDAASAICVRILKHLGYTRTSAKNELARIDADYTDPGEEIDLSCS